MKKKKRYAALLLLGAILISSNSVHASEDYGVPQQVVDIANGSDEIYGDGCPIEHSESRKLRFKSGGVDHTHQYIVANALVILAKDKGNSELNKGDNPDIIMEGTDWPDIVGNETDYLSYSGHFYDPDTGKNWLNESSPTARTRAHQYFKEAVSYYKKGDIDEAMFAIGKGTHYVSDLNEPHHASNLTAVNSNHTAFENYVDKNRNSYKIAGNTLSSKTYQEALDTDLWTMLRDAARYGKSLADEAQNKNTYSIAGKNCVTNAIKSVAQYLYKFGNEVGIY